MQTHYMINQAVLIVTVNKHGTPCLRAKTASYGVVMVLITRCHNSIQHSLNLWTRYTLLYSWFLLSLYRQTLVQSICATVYYTF